MNTSAKIIPCAAVITVAALSGALVSAVVERAAVAASAPTVQTDPRLTTLLKYVKVDEAGNITISGGNINIKGSSFQISADGSATLKGASNVFVQGGGNVSVQGGGTTSIKGSTVTICCPAR